METPQRKLNKTKIGTVVSAAMAKTVTVEVERRVLNQKFKKYLLQHKKFLAHDEKGEYKLGDVVTIEESRPLSRRKCWKVIGKVS